MTVTVYEKDHCVQCVMTKNLLGAHGIEFETADLTEPGNLEAAKSLGYLTAPVVVVGDEHWAGFQPDKIKELAKRLENGER